MKALYPGTFDPITNGHLDVIKRALGMFDELIVCIAKNDSKSPLFKIDDRINMCKLALEEFKNVKVMAFDNLLVDFAKQMKVRVIIRGLRAVSDFEYELQLHYANASLDKNIETIYLMPSLSNAFISSSIVRSIAKYQGDISHLVPKKVYEYMKGSNVYSV